MRSKIAPIATAPKTNDATFGAMLKTCRLQTGCGLRRFCRAHSLDPGGYSKMERGLRPAPRSHEARCKLAYWVGLQARTADWQRFMDLADLSAGQVPQDLLDDESIARNLPLMFVALRGEKLDEKQLQSLAKLIRQAESPEPDATDDSLFI